MNDDFKNKVYLWFFKKCNQGRAHEKNAHDLRVRAIWAFKIGFYKAGCLWLSQP